MLFNVYNEKLGLNTNYLMLKNIIFTFFVSANVIGDLDNFFNKKITLHRT